jgi:hypothetical protein
MQHIATNELAKRAIRGQICVKCYQRPVNSESLPPTHPRSCEPTCPIFDSLRTMQEIVQRDDRQLDSIESALRTIVCSHCKLSPTAGDYCSESLARTCPLSRYALEVVAVLQRLQRIEPSNG